MIRGESLSKRYGDVTALSPTDIDIQTGKITAIMGGSGSGKTTLLRLLAGLEKPSGGHVWYGDEDLCAMPVKRLYELRESMGMLFQYSALLNSLNVYDNVAFPLHEHTELDESVISTMVSMKLEQVGLRGFEQLMRQSSPVAWPNAWLLPVPWPWIRALYFLMNPHPDSIRSLPV